MPIRSHRHVVFRPVSVVSLLAGVAYKTHCVIASFFFFFSQLLHLSAVTVVLANQRIAFELFDPVRMGIIEQQRARRLLVAFSWPVFLEASYPFVQFRKCSIYRPLLIKLGSTSCCILWLRRKNQSLHFMRSCYIPSWTTYINLRLNGCPVKCYTYQASISHIFKIPCIHS